MKKVAIVGTGVSGLACAAMLKDKGVDVTLFEKESASGGKLSTEQRGDFLFEYGADSFLPEKFWTVQLIRKIGMADQMITTNEQYKGTYLYSGGKLHILPDGIMLMVPTMFWPLAKSSLISWPGKIRMGIELFVPPRLESGDESLASFVTRRLGKECLDKIAEPLVAGIHTSNPDNMSVLATFPRFVDMEKKSGSLIKGMIAAMKKMPPKDPNAPKMTFFMSFRKGMYQFIEGLRSYIGEDRIRMNREVTQVSRDGEGYRVAFKDGSSEQFDYVVLSTASYVSEPVVRDLDGTLAGMLSAIEWSSSATVNLAFRKSDINIPLKGFGFIVPRVEKKHVNASTWSSIKWSYRAPDDHVLIRSFVGGGHHEEVVAFDDAEIVRIIMNDLKDICGIDAKPVDSKVYRWNKGMPKYTVGHIDRIAKIDERMKQHPGLYLIGCSYKGIGIGDSVKSGMDAAADIEKRIAG